MLLLLAFRYLLRLWYGLWLAGRVGIDSPPLCLLRPCMPAVAGQDSVSLLTLSEETFPYSVASGTLVDLSYKGERQLGLHTLSVPLASARADMLEWRQGNLSGKACWLYWCPLVQLLASRGPAVEQETQLCLSVQAASSPLRRHRTPSASVRSPASCHMRLYRHCLFETVHADCNTWTAT